MNKCNVCGNGIDYKNGGFALTFTSAGQGNVNMICVSLCKHCYNERKIQQKIVELAEAANFKVIL